MSLKKKNKGLKKRLYINRRKRKLSWQNLGKKNEEINNIIELKVILRSNLKQNKCD